MKEKLQKFLKYFMYSCAALIVLSILSVVVYRFVAPPVTPLMIIRYGEGIVDGEDVGIEKEWKDYSEISPNLYKAIIAIEDGKFMRHGGIDWKAVEVAREYNVKHKGKRLHGASTITMQTAKNTFLWHGRNYIRKGLELYFTLLIEAIWGKKRILEVYVNVVEWGHGVYGAEAAAQAYFGKSAKTLSKRQAALLAAVLPNPRRWSPKKPTHYINRRVSTILKRMQSVRIPKKDKK